MTGPLVRARGLSRSFVHPSGRSVTAVQGVDLDVHAGEMVLVNGPSGSGKTTLLSMVGCLIAPTEGVLEIDGRPTAGLPGDALPEYRLRRFGFVFQTFRLIGALTVLENVRLPLQLAGVPHSRAIERARSLLAELGLQDRTAFTPEVLSGGEKQRVALARAFALDPPILLADEPTGSLDSQAGQGVIRILHTAAKERNKAVLVVSHDKRIVEEADRVMGMEDGRLAGRPPA
jgi:putative ABC transport system ATP-binding protein